MPIHLFSKTVLPIKMFSRTNDLVEQSADVFHKYLYILDPYFDKLFTVIHLHWFHIIYNNICLYIAGVWCYNDVKHAKRFHVSHQLL